MLQTISKPAAWAAFAAIVLVALFPSGAFLPLPSDFADRAMRYGVLAFLLMLAYPRSILATSLLVGLSSLSLELVQLLSPTKRMDLTHLLPNLGGASLGLVLGVAALFLLQARADR